MKVLQVSKLYAPWIGGVEKVVQIIAEGLSRSVQMQVLTCQPLGRGQQDVLNGVPITRASSFGILWSMPISPTFPFLLARMSRRVDILHVHCPFPLAVLAYLALGSRQCRLIVTYHSDIVRQRVMLPLYGPFLRSFLRKADKIIVTSPHLLESSPYLRPYRPKCVVIPLSINVQEHLEPVLPDKPLEFPTDRPTVLFVGRLNYYKGLSYLVTAMQSVNAQLLVVGDGELRSKLEAQVSQLGLQGRVFFMGSLSGDDLRYCYQQCDVFVLPSTESSEAFGLVQLEAMIHGKPVVNTSLSTGVPYVSVDGETGLTVAPRDAEALSNAINRILLDRGLAHKFGVNAVSRVQELFSSERTLNDIQSLYHEEHGY